MTKRKYLICIDENPLLSVVSHQLLMNHSLVVHPRHTKYAWNSLIICILAMSAPIAV